MPTRTLPMTSFASAERFRLMVVDLDSIVSATGTLNPSDASALRAAHAAGIKVVLASALLPQAIHRYWAQLGLGEPVIAFGDALVYDFPSHKARLGQPLDGDMLLAFLQNVQRSAPKAAVVLETADGWVTNRIGSYAQATIERTGLWPQVISNFSAALAGPVYRVTVEAATARLDELHADGLDLQTSRKFPNLREVEPDWLQLQSAAANREWAVSALAGLEEVSLDEVVAIGGRGSDGARLDAVALAALMTTAVAGNGLLVSDPAPSGSYGDGGDTPGELEPAGSDTDLWPTIER